MGLFSKLIGKRSSAKKPAKKQSDASNSRYRAVQVNAHAKDCCDAVQALAGRRFLSDEVPKLPLEDCDAAECRCTYRLYDDRRADVRRSSDLTYDIASQLHADNNRNDSIPGRRKND